MNEEDNIPTYSCADHPEEYEDVLDENGNKIYKKVGDKEFVLRRTISQPEELLCEDCLDNK